MRDALRCPDCGERQIWHVAAVKDLSLFRVPFVIWSGQTALATTEIYLCGVCGRVEWYAANLASEAAESAARPPLGCASCAGQRVIVVPAHDSVGAESVPMPLRIDGDEATGRLELLVCVDCARVLWRAPERGDVGRPGDAREPGACAVCGSADRWRIPSRDLRSIDHSGGVLSDIEEHLQSERRAIAVRPRFIGEQTWGALDTVVCAPCGAVTWSARGMDQLREDPAWGVRLLKIPEAKGPYR